MVPFDLGGVLADAPIALRRDGEGRFVAIGDANTADNSAAALVRLTPDGMLDNTFGTLGTLAVSSAAPGAMMYGDVGSGLAIAPDGSLIATSYAVVDAAGHARVGVAKLVGDTIFSGRFDF